MSPRHPLARSTSTSAPADVDVARTAAIILGGDITTTAPTIITTTMSGWVPVRD